MDRRWDGSIVAGERAAELISDRVIAETVDTLNSHLAASGIETKLVVRPEIFNSGRARTYIAEKVPGLCGHIFVGPPQQLKYLKGARNLACFTPICSMEEADQICRGLAYNPRRLRNVRAALNGFAVATLLGEQESINRPMLLPKKAISSAASAGPGGHRMFSDPVAAPLFLNNHDANNSAHVMLSRLKPLTQHLASHPQILQRAPVFLAALAPDCDLPTGIAPALRDFAYLALAGMQFIVIIMIEGASSLTLETLEGVAQRLNTSLKIAGFHPSLIDSDAIILIPGSSQIGGLLGVSDYLLLFDFDWPESEINQLAIRAGVKPMLLTMANPDLRELFLETALVIPSGTDNIRPRAAAEAATPFDYPATGSLQKLLANSLVEHLSLKSRAANIKHAQSVFQNVSARLKTVLEWKEMHEVHFG